MLVGVAVGCAVFVAPGVCSVAGEAEADDVGFVVDVELGEAEAVTDGVPEGLVVVD